MTRTEQAAPAARPRPRLVELDSLPATFSARASRSDQAHARIAVDRPHLEVPAQPAVQPAEPQPSQALVRYVRKAAATLAGVESPSPAPPRRGPAPSRARSRRRDEQVVDVTEELVAVVGDRLGLAASAIAHAMYGKDTSSTRARVTGLLDGLGPRGREMALRLARLMLDRL